MKFVKTYESFQFGDEKWVLLSKDGKLCMKITGYSTASFGREGHVFKMFEIKKTSEVTLENYEDVLYPFDTREELMEKLESHFEGKNISCLDYVSNKIYTYGYRPELYQYYPQEEVTLDDIKEIVSEYEPVNMIIGGFTNENDPLI